MRYLLLFLVILCSCSQKLQEIKGVTMGTTYMVKYFGGDKKQLSAEMELVLEAVNNRMSTYRPYSELSKLNNSRDIKWQKISPELEYVISYALDLSKQSNGVYDVTLGPLVNLWGFGPVRTTTIPSEIAINEALKNIGHKKINLKNGFIKKSNPELYVDLSSIAKGYGVDRLAMLLEKHGVWNYLVEIGGELKSRGTKGGKPWSVAIQKPSDNGEISYILKLNDGVVATSGDYRNYFTKGTTRYSHTIDVNTGRPVQNDLASVTVVGGDSCMKVDAQATMLLALGFAKAKAFAEANGISTFFIRRSGKELVVVKSTKFEEHFND